MNPPGVRYDVESRWREFWSALPMNSFMDLQLLDYEQESGQVTITMPFRRELGNMPDHSGVHGGALAALIDAVSNFALGIKVGSDMTLTTNLRVDYLTWAPPDTIIGRAEVTHVGRRNALVDVELKDTAGVKLAVGRVGLSYRPGS